MIMMILIIMRIKEWVCLRCVWGSSVCVFVFGVLRYSGVLVLGERRICGECWRWGSCGDKGNDGSGLSVHQHRVPTNTSNQDDKLSRHTRTTPAPINISNTKSLHTEDYEPLVFWRLSPVLFHNYISFVLILHILGGLVSKLRNRW